MRRPKLKWLPITAPAKEAVPGGLEVVGLSRLGLEVVADELQHSGVQGASSGKNKY